MTGFHIPFEADGFPAGFPLAGLLPSSWPALLRSAASLAGSTAGAGRTATAWLPGNVLEFAWRIALVGANLRQQRSWGPAQALRQTDQYRSLDPSEKGAVSFFLGQVSAKHFAEHLLAAPVFARVDEVMQAAGLPLTGRRPDFYGWGPAVGAFVVEAKGRSGMWNNHTMQQAKQQAELLAPVLGGGNHAALAHMAYFQRREWKAWLMDPPPRRSQGPAPTLESVLVAYYRPFVQLLGERGSGEVAVATGADHDMAELPEVDVRLGLRQDLREAFTQLGLSDEARGARLRLALAGMGDFVDQDGVEQSRAALDRAAQLAEQETAAGSSAGADGVLLQAGPSWGSDLMSLEPEQRPVDA